MQKSNLLKQIMAFEFCLVDLTQYLDTHRDDKAMIALFNEYKGVLDELKSKYQDMYGPLTPMTTSNDYWNWTDGPWPWEGECR